jgi:hypothetical protein
VFAIARRGESAGAGGAGGERQAQQQTRGGSLLHAASIDPPRRRASAWPRRVQVHTSGMRLAHAFLVIVDISGYTAFINERQTSLLHAEQIITELMEAVIDRAAHPLTVEQARRRCRAALRRGRGRRPGRRARRAGAGEGLLPGLRRLPRPPSARRAPIACATPAPASSACN